VVLPDPETVTDPGDIVTVQVPEEGSPLNGTLPEGTLHVGWVIVPTAGAEGVAGWELIVTLPDESDVHPDEFVTVKV
jgi:hypothetical protein